MHVIYDTYIYIYVYIYIYIYIYACLCLFTDNYKFQDYRGLDK